MFFEEYKNLLYSDCLVPDIFISEYLPSMEGDYLKIYLYCLFLSKYNKPVSAEGLSKKLDMELKKVNDALAHFENLGIITKKDTNIILSDLKEKEITKIYRMKATSTPDEALLSSERNKQRNRIISAINDKFFQGIMSPSWYADLDSWFDKYKFDEDVMYSLFQHCYDHKGLSKNYILKVAENWYSKNITNSFDLDKYYIQYQKIKDLRLKIIKKLNLTRYLTEYEDALLEKWTMVYNYDFDIIECALKKTTSKTNPNFSYIDAILTNWFNEKLTTLPEIENYTTKNKNKYANKNAIKQNIIPQHVNFEQRDYNKEDYNSFIANSGK